MVPYPTIDPIAFSLGDIHIRWYGLAYVAGIILAWQCCVAMIRKGYFALSEKDLGDFIPWATLGIVAGGRLGHVLFYGGDYYWHHPEEILMIWKPGMSFHGGLMGVLVATYTFCQSRSIPLLSFLDLISIGTPIGLFFGRLANFINGELWGRVTDAPLGMVFPGAGPLPRHPSQLYEAALEGILLLGIQLMCARFVKDTQKKPGMISGCFALSYALLRSVAEYFREPVDGYIGPLTAGQFWCVPLLCLGIALIYHSVTSTPEPSSTK